MASATLESPAPRAFRLRRDDLLVKAVSVQGGETHIAGEKTDFAKIVMTGVTWDQARPGADPVRRQQSVVLKLDQVGQLVEALREVLNAIARSTPTPLIPAMGPWSWTSDALRPDDLVVADADADGMNIPGVRGTTRTVRVDFSGTAVHALTSDDQPVHVHGAIFSGPRQVQTLISSLKKVVRSALEQRRIDIYVGGDAIFISQDSNFATYGY
jgi:hypothetical protein